MPDRVVKKNVGAELPDIAVDDGKRNQTKIMEKSAHHLRLKSDFEESLENKDRCAGD
jgi:hypothetical protein